MEIIRLIYRAHQKLSAIEATPRDYGTGTLLYASEIHTLNAVGRKPGANLTELAEELNVSKSAVSKFVRKLEDKKHLEKRSKTGNRKEVSFYLNDAGEIAVEGHKEFELRVFGPLYRREEELSSQERSLISGFLEDLHLLI
jgi:DNA-binding MarR family transcriptional regulator